MEEIWKDIKGFEGHYQISNYGNVKSLERFVDSSRGLLKKNEQINKHWVDSHTGYKRIKIYKDKKEYRFYIHRLIAQAFIPNPENKREVNHIDGDKLNNSIENLEWNTPKENIQNAILRGAINKRGENGTHSKLEMDDAYDIRLARLINPKRYSKNKLIALYGLGARSMYDVIHNISYKSHPINV